MSDPIVLMAISKSNEIADLMLITRELNNQRSVAATGTLFGQPELPKSIARVIGVHHDTPEEEILKFLNIETTILILGIDETNQSLSPFLVIAERAKLLDIPVCIYSADPVFHTKFDATSPDLQSFRTCISCCFWSGECPETKTRIQGIFKDAGVISGCNVKRNPNGAQSIARHIEEMWLSHVARKCQ